MTETSPADLLPGWVLAGWGRRVRSVGATDPGMNSRTAVVDLDGERFVAKWVPTSGAEALAAGSALARRLAQAGLATGEPLLTRDGKVSFATPDGALALLHFVPGSPLMGESAADQALMGTTLARVHACAATTGSAPYLADLLPLVHDVEPWVRPAVVAVLAEQARLPPLTWGILHADPVPDAFRHDPASGRTGLIDWSGAHNGPVLYDLASALMYLGGPRRGRVFWTTYLDHSPAPAAELTTHLDAFHRLRGAVQAAYFSFRVATGDLTGIADQRDNWKGLRDAPRMLAANGVAVGGIVR